MALTVLKTPTDYNFSRNRNLVEIQTNNFSSLVNQGRKASCYFNGLHNAVLNKTLTITFGVTTIVYTFKAATNIALKEVEKYGGIMSFEAYMVQLANDLRSDIALSTYIDITPYGTAIIFTAKLGGTAFNMGASTTNATGVGFYQSPGTDDIVTVNRPNYKLVLELFGEQSPGVWESIAAEGKEPANNKISWDLSDFIDSYLEYNFPDFSNPISFKCSTVCRRFYVKILEMYGTPPVAVATSISPGGIMANATDTNPYFSLKAGLDEISARILPTLQFNTFAVNNSFMTRQNRVKKISRNQIEYLYYLFLATLTGTACIRYTFYDAAGNTTVVNTHHTTAITAFDVWAFPIHRVAGYFSQNPEYVKMEVAVHDVTTTAQLSETFTYLADDDFKMEEKFFYFANSDGGMDTVRCCGVDEASHDFNGETVERTRTGEDGELDGDIEQIYTEKQDGGQAFSGFVKKSELVYIQELILTRKAFMYGNQYGQNIKIPIIILNKKLVSHKTNENLFGYIIEYKEAFIQTISQANFYPVV